MKGCAVYRVEDYVVRVLSRSRLPLGILAGVEPGWTLTGNIDADIRWSGTMTVINPDINWNEVFLQPVHRNLTTGVETSLGVFLAAPVNGTDGGPSTKVKLTLFDLTKFLDDDAWEDAKATDAGAKAMDIVRAAITSAGLASPSITGTDATLPMPMFWDPNTSKMRQVNDVLEALGYVAVWVDRNGQFQVQPYIEPAGRPVVYRFDPSDTAIHLPEDQWKQKTSIANRVIAYSEESADHPMMKAIAINDDPTNEFSIPRQGRVITQPYENVKAASQAVLAAYAKRMLNLGTTANRTHTRQMAFHPLDLSDIVTAGNTRETVENIQITGTPGALMKIETREVL